MKIIRHPGKMPPIVYTRTRTRTICGMIPWMFWTLLAAVLFSVFGPFVAVALRGQQVQTEKASTSQFLTTGSTFDWSKATVTNVLAFQLNSGSETILTISPIPVNKSAKPADITELWPQYIRPEKPDDITVKLWTKDGKCWQAVWREIKP